MNDPYSRKVSSEEAREGYLMVTKDRLAYFPPLGAPFVILMDGTALSAKVESYPCTCRGPEKPHEHYFLRVPGLTQGQRVTIAAEPGDVRRFVFSRPQ
jgi:hypothetical protein